MEYRIWYPQIPNMGDLLNKDMLEPLFHIKVKRVNYEESNISAIGSSLSLALRSHALYSLNFKRRIKQGIIKIFNIDPFYIWGTGFMDYNTQEESIIQFRNIKFLSLRGNLSKNRVEKILGKKLNIPTGDGGLLVDRWIGEKQPKKYRIGIIPHFKEKDSPIVGEMKKKYSDSVIIDLGKKPIDVVKEIASCETILSSSLHGLIVADSFHIPNKHILLYPYGERMLGDGFKFADYYSSYGLNDTPLDVTTSNWPTIQSIIEDYCIDPSVVEKKKDEIFSVFPR
jgi:hypothetical protein